MDITVLILIILGVLYLLDAALYLCLKHLIIIRLNIFYDKHFSFQLIEYISHLFITNVFVLYLLLFFHIHTMYIWSYVLSISYTLWLFISILDTLFNDVSGKRNPKLFYGLHKPYYIQCGIECVLFIIISGLIMYSLNSKTQGVVLPIYSAILTGIVTMLGVVLTIRHEKEVRDKNDKLKYKPMFILTNSNSKYFQAPNRILHITDKNNIGYDKQGIKQIKFEQDFYIYQLNEITLENSNHSNFVIDDIIIDNQEYANSLNCLVK